MPEPLIPKHGGYRNLKSFQVAQLVFDVTVRFVDRYIDNKSRTRDQMTQAARSGVQNIAEGSQASATSKKMEMKLTNVARASLEELKLDYEDFLRRRGLSQWDKYDPRRKHLMDRRCKTADEVAQWIEQQHDGLHGLNGPTPTPNPPSPSPSIPSIPSIKSIAPTQNPTYPELAANAALTLIYVATALLDRQLSAQSESFKKDGGFTEHLYNTRAKARRHD